MTSDGALDRKLADAVDRLGRALRTARQAVATSHGLSVLQVQVIERIDADGPIAVGELAREVDVTQPTMTDAIAALHAKGIVERRRTPPDRRITRVSLTARGARLARRIAQDLAPVLGPAVGDEEDPAVRGERNDRSGSSSRSEDRATALAVLIDEIVRLQAAGVISVARTCPSCASFTPATATDAARCELLGVPLARRDLRVDCGEHVSRPRSTM